jgi:hypothetical protein
MTTFSVWKKACTVFALWAGTEIASQAQMFETLVNFGDSVVFLPLFLRHSRPR